MRKGQERMKEKEKMVGERKGKGKEKSKGRGRKEGISVIWSTLPHIWSCTWKFRAHVPLLKHYQYTQGS